MHFPLIAIDFDLSGAEQFTCCMLYTDNTWNSEFARDNRTV
jgi:hypothetical protein